jgi:PDZ domain-containing protein
MAKHKPGDVITVKYLDSFVTDASAAKQAQFATIAAPDDPNRPLIGFMPHDTRSVTVPYETTIDTNQIGGPSAGLAFTLTLIDALSPGSLTGGHRVAVTGTIAEDGSVGEIGGLHQKTVAVKEAGADVFLVPVAQGDAQIADARKTAGKGIQVIPVATLDDALNALAALGGDPIPPLVQG